MKHICPKCGKRALEGVTSPDGEKGYICRECKWGCEEERLNEVYANDVQEELEF